MEKPVAKIDMKNMGDVKKHLEEIDWQIDYGSVKIQIREKKATLIVLERTYKLD